MQKLTINALYKYHLTHKAADFDLFSYILNNYSRLESMKSLFNTNSNQDTFLGCLKENGMVPRNFTMDMLSYVECGDIHLSYVSQKKKCVNHLIKVFYLYQKGATVREFIDTLGISAHTVKKCKYIIVNSLALSYRKLYSNVA